MFVKNKYPAKILEQAYYCNQSITNNLIHIIISFNSKLDIDILKKAIRLSLFEVPLLRSIFVVNWWKPYWQLKEDIDQLPYFNFFKIDNVNEELKKFTSSTFNPTQSPHLQIIVFRSEIDTMCVKLSHIVTDVAGAKMYLRLLASIYRKLKDGASVNIPHFSNNRSLCQVSNSFGWLDKVRILKRTVSDQKKYTLSYNQPINFHFEHNKTISFITRIIHSERFFLLRKYASEYGCTLNDILLAAFNRALFSYYCDHVESITEMVLNTRIYADLRRYLSLEQKETICNLSSTVYPTIVLNNKDEFRDTLCKVYGEMKLKKNDFMGLGDLPIIVALFKCLPFFVSQAIFLRLKKQKINSGNLYPVLSNFGRIDGEGVSFGHIKTISAIFLPPVFFTPTIGVGFSVFNHVLTLSSGTFENSVHQKVVENILDRLLNELPG